MTESNEITQKYKCKSYCSSALHVFYLKCVDIYIEFREDSLNGFQVIERTRFCDRVQG